MLQAVRFQVAVSALCAAFLTSGHAHAGETWDGGGANNNWTTALNWNSDGPGRDSAPDNDGTADIVMAGTTRLTPRVDVDWDINSLTFNSTAGGFSISGDPGVSLGIGAGGITNNDTQTQILLLPIALDASQTWNAAAGPLNIANTVAGHPLLARTLTLDGANNINIAGAITTRITLNKTGTGTLTFNGLNTNTYTGSTTISAGTLVLDRTGGPNGAIPEDLIIGDGMGGAGADVVRLDAADQITEAAGRTVTVNSSGLLNLNGFNDTLANLAINGGSISGSGSLIVNEALTFTGGGSISTAAVSTLTSVVVNGGLLSIANGGQLTRTIGSIVSAAGSTTSVDVSGARWSFDTANDSVFEIGASGSVVLNITNGGIVGCATCSGGRSVTRVGGSASSTGFGEVNIDNGTWGNDFLSVYGGSLELSAGLIDAWVLQLHGSESSTASAVVEGSLSRVRIGHRLDVGSIVGKGGILEIRDGARVEGIHPDTIVSVHKNGSLLVLGGSTLNAGPAIISGGSADAGAIATVDGPGSSWTTNGRGLGVGNDGTATLNITNGGRVQSGGCVIGNSADGGGTVIVNGSSETRESELIVRGMLEVDGALHISDGGLVQLFFDSIPFPFGEIKIGGSAGSVGLVTVSGSSLFSEGTLNVYEQGELRISNNSDVRILDIEPAPPTEGDSVIRGTVTVESGSEFRTDDELDIRGSSAAATLEILTGGSVNSGRATIGGFENSSGTVTVDGVGSTWSSGSIQVAVDGAGVLSVTNGGTVFAPNLLVGPLGEINGNGNVVGLLENGGLVSPGMSAGALDVDGDYSQSAAGELLIELASASSFDQLLITGEADLSGLLTVNLIDGFMPSAGQSFTIITADDIVDTFTMEAFPSVPNLAFDVVYNVQSVVLTVSSVGLPGDFNGDGAVDAADYVVWRKTDGSQQGYDNWRANFGASNRGGSLAAIPEPVSFAMLMIGVSVVFTRRRTAVSLNS